MKTLTESAILVFILALIALSIVNSLSNAPEQRTGHRGAVREAIEAGVPGDDSAVGQAKRLPAELVR